MKRLVYTSHEDRKLEHNVRAEVDEAAIDRTLADSFPASDPPSWTLGVHGSATGDQAGYAGEELHQARDATARALVK